MQRDIRTDINKSVDAFKQALEAGSGAFEGSLLGRMDYVINLAE